MRRVAYQKFISSQFIIPQYRSLFLPRLRPPQRPIIVCEEWLLQLVLRGISSQRFTRLLLDSSFRRYCIFKKLTFLLIRLRSSELLPSRLRLCDTLLGSYSSLFINKVVLDMPNLSTRDYGLLSAPLSYVRSGSYSWSSTGLSYRGSSGYYWSLRSYTTTNSDNLGFDSSGLSPQNYHNRGYGFAVHRIIPAPRLNFPTLTILKPLKKPRFLRAFKNRLSRQKLPQALAKNLLAHKSSILFSEAPNPYRTFSIKKLSYSLSRPQPNPPSLYLPLSFESHFRPREFVRLLSPQFSRSPPLNHIPFRAGQHSVSTLET